jgi:hypothetical protein
MGVDGEWIKPYWFIAIGNQLSPPSKFAVVVSSVYREALVCPLQNVQARAFSSHIVSYLSSYIIGYC